MAGVVAAVPVVRMFLLVLQAHRLPYNDYWPMIDSVLTDDGGLDVGGLFELRNEHPIVVAASCVGTQERPSAAPRPHSRGRSGMRVRRGRRRDHKNA